MVYKNSIIIILTLFRLFSLNVCDMLYDEHMAKEAVLLSQASYCSNSLDFNSFQNNSQIYHVIEKEGEKALLGYNEEYNSIFVSFRGSTNIQNWLKNIQIEKISPYEQFQEIAVEEGFYKAYKILDSDIYDKIKDISLKYNVNNLFITGHSLGAALATLLAFDIVSNNKYNKINITSLITFGSPRVGNQQFVNLFNSHYINSFRITHYYDIAPHVPQEFIGYVHISREIWYNEDNSIYKICNDIDNNEDSKCSNSCAPTKCTSTKDHLNYLNISIGSGDC